MLHDVKANTDLAKSPGWKVVEEVMKEEIVSLALQTARNPKKPQKRPLTMLVAYKPPKIF